MKDMTDGAFRLIAWCRSNRKQALWIAVAVVVGVLAGFGALLEDQTRGGSQPAADRPATNWRHQADRYGAFKAASMAAADDVGWPGGLKMEASIACVGDNRVTVVDELVKQRYCVVSWLEDASGRAWYRVFVERVGRAEWRLMREEDGQLMARWFMTDFGEVDTRFEER